MTEIQMKLLDMIKWFHNYCVDNNLQYYALGGTALGAVRHKGFIPWDDDIDVGMPRSDYEKLIEMSKSQDRDGRYVIESPLEKEDFIYPFCKLYNTDTTLVENARFKIKRGIFIDIFPLDGIGNTEKESKINYRKTDFWVNILNTKICALRKGRSFFKNLSIVFGRMIPEFILGRAYLIRKINNAVKQRVYEENQYVVNIFGSWKEREIVKKEWLGNPTLCEFEDTQIFIPEKFDRYLTAVYGDWRKLPPKEKQVTHHVFLECDLDKSYFEE